MGKLQGADIAHWSPHNIGWRSAMDAGLVWCGIKISQRDFPDPKAVHYVETARNAGLRYILPYHYLDPIPGSADMQFDQFMDGIEACGGWDDMLVPALDVEGDKRNELRQMSSARYCALALEWLQLLESEIGRKGVVYTYPSFNTEHGVGRVLGDFPLWAASYRRSPAAFSGWPGGPLYWQYTEDGSWPGMGDGLDLDFFMGDEAKLAEQLVGHRQKPLIVGPDGRGIPAADAQWVGNSITVAGVPLLRVLGLPTAPLPSAIHADTGRAFISELEPSLAPWRCFYRDTPQGPRVYLKRIQ